MNAIAQQQNPLINVFNAMIDNVNQLAVNARDLHAFLKIGRDFSTWIKKRIEEYQFVANLDFISFSQNGEKPTGGRPTVEYHLTLDMAKELAMVENNEQGRKIRRYFIRCEKDLYKSDSEKRKLLVSACTKLSAGNMAISDVYKMVGGQFGYDNIVDIPTPLLPEAIAFVYEMLLRSKPTTNPTMDESLKQDVRLLITNACLFRSWFNSVKAPIGMLNPKIITEISTILAWGIPSAEGVNKKYALGVDTQFLLNRNWLASRIEN